MVEGLIKLAQEMPEMRQYLVPIIRQRLASMPRTSGGAYHRVTGGQRNQYEDAVWSMFVKTYSRIGLILSNPSQLYRYHVWDVARSQTGPVAFNLYKKTSFGLKSGLAGSDLSSAGKRLTVAQIRSKFLVDSMYGEVSHKVEDIAVAAGAPAICVQYVPGILGKQVKPLEDGVHYVRSIPGVGLVTKILLGRPRGVPVTNPKKPACSLSFTPPDLLADDIDEEFDVLAHYACVNLE